MEKQYTQEDLEQSLKNIKEINDELRNVLAVAFEKITELHSNIIRASDKLVEIEQLIIK